MHYDCFIFIQIKIKYKPLMINLFLRDRLKEQLNMAPFLCKASPPFPVFSDLH